MALRTVGIFDSMSSELLANSVFDRTAGSHTLATADQRER